MSLQMIWALARLTPTQREAFLDTHLCGEPPAAIASRLGVTPQTVWQIVYRARLLLLETLTRWGYA